MPTTISGTNGIDKVVDGAIVQADLAANVVGNGAMWRGTNSSFTNSANPSQVVTLTQTNASSVVQSGANVTPSIAGWYICNITGLCTGTTTGLGLGIVIAGATAFQAQPPYSSNLAYATATALAYFNGTTDSASFMVFGTVNGCSFSDIIGTLILVRAA